MTDGRVCTRCKAFKPRASFNIARHLRDGMDTRCKDCQFVLRVERSSRLGQYCLLQKVCTHCGVEKPRDDFPSEKGRMDGKLNICRRCDAQKATERRRQLKESAPVLYEQRVLEPARKSMAKRRAAVLNAGGRPGDLSKEWRQRNREALLAAKRKWREDRAAEEGRVLRVRLTVEERQRVHEARAKKRSERKLARERDRLTPNERYRKKMETDPCYVINQRMRVSIGKAMRGRKDGRSWQTVLGYTRADLEASLRRQIPRGYSFDDFKTGKLHLDHIIPKSMFDVTKPEELRACWALTNLRPLPAKQNLKKGAKRVSLL